MMKSLALFIAPLFICTGLAFGGDAVIVVIDNKLVKADQVVSPTIKLTGAETPAALGDIVPIQAVVSNQYPTYVKSTTFEWKVSENGYLKRFWGQDSQIMFGAGITPTKILVELKATFTYTVGTQDVTITQSQKAEVTVGTPTPTPPTPTPPTPTPPTPTPPTPTPAPTLTGAAKFAYDTAIAKGPADKSSAVVLASSFQAIAAQIGHNTAFNDPATLLKATKESNNAMLLKAGFKANAWDVFGTELQDYLWAQYQAKSLQTVDDYKAVWQDIAQGLALVK